MLFLLALPYSNPYLVKPSTGKFKIDYWILAPLVISNLIRRARYLVSTKEISPATGRPESDMAYLAQVPARSVVWMNRVLAEVATGPFFLSSAIFSYSSSGDIRTGSMTSI